MSLDIWDGNAAHAQTQAVSGTDTRTATRRCPSHSHSHSHSHRAHRRSRMRAAACGRGMSWMHLHAPPLGCVNPMLTYIERMETCSVRVAGQYGNWVQFFRFENPAACAENQKEPHSKRVKIRVCDTLQTFQGLPHLETFWIGHLLICAVPAVAQKYVLVLATRVATLENERELGGTN